MRRRRAGRSSRRSEPTPPPWLACSQSSQNMCVRASSRGAISALPGPSAPIRLTCWPGRSDPFGKQHLMARCDRHHEVGAERLLARSGDLRRELVSDRPRSVAVDVPDQRHAPPSGECSRSREAVHAGADHRCTRGIVAPERLGRDHRGRARAQRSHRAGVEQRLELTGLGVRQQDHSADGRQPASRVARERVDPLQQRVTAAPSAGIARKSPADSS